MTPVALIRLWRSRARIYEKQALSYLVGSDGQRINAAKARALNECAAELEAASSEEATA